MNLRTKGFTKKEKNEFLAAGEQEIALTKLFFFPVASAATCIDSHLEVDQSFHLEYNELRFE
ncbi:hypothetical protein Taro_000765, partial [Colocasia esculenta]|nr:hypothetical protein [Colocasia esculenta]